MSIQDAINVEYNRLVTERDEKLKKKQDKKEENLSLLMSEFLSPDEFNFFKFDDRKTQPHYIFLTIFGQLYNVFYPKDEGRDGWYITCYEENPSWNPRESEVYIPRGDFRDWIVKEYAKKKFNRDIGRKWWQFWKLGD